MKTILKTSVFLVLIFLLSCNQQQATSDKTPLPSVETVHPIRGDIQQKEQLNGQVIYLNKTTITAPVSGYVSQVNTAIGNWVKKGELLFKIQTKESRALKNADLSTPGEFGIIPVYSSVSGFIQKLDVTEANVFINEGNPMATIVNNADIVIQVNAPFEYSRFLSNVKNIEVGLSNKQVYDAVFYKAIQQVDPVSQTQQILFKLKNQTTLPENLNVLVTFILKERSNSILLPKEAILTNETEDEFWIMMVTKDSVAIKIPIIKGMDSDGKIEILSPELKLSDEIIQKGGYGLPDSTKVKMMSK